MGFKIMLNLFVITVLAVSCCYAENSPTCGQRPFVNSFMNKIVNGYESSIGDWGWQVSLTNQGNHFCGGVLINSQWILTAAHCFQSSYMPYLAIDLGMHNRNLKESWSINRKGAKVIIHPNWSMSTMRNDIAMVKLDKPVAFDNKYIIEACMPLANNYDVQGKTGWITGWGSSQVGGRPSIKLMEVTMPIQSNNECRQRYGSMVDTDSALCAGVYSGNLGACQGDSGGPFVTKNDDGKWYITGLTSWGPVVNNRCGYGTVFTRVSYYVDWIEHTIARN